MLKIALAFAAAFLGTLILTPVYIRSAIAKGITGRDVNKNDRPQVAEMGGFAIFAGILLGILSAIVVFTFVYSDAATTLALLAAVGTLSLLALIGVFDDLFRLTPATKAIMPIVGSLPLVVTQAGQTAMNLPLLKTVNFGPLYNFVLVPLGVTGAANAVNMAAGYNGLEAGIGAIGSFFLLAIAIQVNETAAAIILAACLGACLAFLLYNRFPAKVFPGDIGTLVIGGVFASAVITGNIEKYGVIILLPAFYELAATIYYTAKGVNRREKCHNPVISPDGKLSPPKGAEKYTLMYLILSKKPMTEQKIVLTTLSLYAICGIAALAVYYFKV